MNTGDFYQSMITRFLSEQMEHGEFGLSRNPQVEGTVSPYHQPQLLGKKANSFITMYAIEMLHKLNLDNIRKRKAISWFISRISAEGYFISNVTTSEQVEDLVTGEIATTKSTIKIFRHTSEALASMLLVDGVTSEAVKLLENLLAAQNQDGGWSDTSSMRESQLLATAFTLKAFTIIDSNEIVEKGYALFERERKKLELDAAILRALNWFAKKSTQVGGLWYSEAVGERNRAFYTGIILGMNAKRFCEHYSELTTILVDQLIAIAPEGLWAKDGVIDIDGSARVLAALVKLRKFMYFEFDFPASFEAIKDAIINGDGLNKLDPATLCFIIDAFFEQQITGVSNKYNVIDSIVLVSSKNGKSLGTGFICEIDGRLVCLTCRHLFTNLEDTTYLLTFCNGISIESNLIMPKYLDPPTTTTSANHDVAVLQFTQKEEPFLPMSFSPRPKMSCSSFGYGTSTRGRGRWITDITIVAEVAKGFYELKTTEKVAEDGYSGSPVLNFKNEVVGMIQSIKGEKTIYMVPCEILVNSLRGV